MEIQYLYEIGRITEPATTVFADLKNVLALSICRKEFIAVIGTATDCTWIRDPFDRIIVAHASLDNSVLITKDEQILTHYRQALWR